VDPTAEADITGVATLDEAGPRDVSFLANPKYLSKVGESRAGAVLVTPDFQQPAAAVLLKIGNPYLAFAHAIEVFHQATRPATGVHPSAVVGKGVVLGRDVSVGPHCCVGDGVRLGDGVVLHPHAVVYPGAELGEGCVVHSFAVVREGVRLGRRVVLQNGAVVGADGFGFAPRGDGSWHKIPQVGTVVVGDDVEIQANACVDRAAVGQTVLGRGTKVDNLVQVGHGCKVGEDTLLCGQVGLAGSTEIGNRVMLAGQVGIAGHVRIGDDISIAAASGVPKSLLEPGEYSGAPAVPARDHGVMIAMWKRLPEMQQRLKEVERRLEAVAPTPPPASPAPRPPRSP
jgi:UDP-3-O-[3-hydroxymyristoyl] glucosamine N-acyltransferase